MATQKASVKRSAAVGGTATGCAVAVAYVANLLGHPMDAPTAAGLGGLLATVLSHYIPNVK